MNTTRRKPRDDPDEAAQNALVIGENHFDLTIAESLTEGVQSVAFVSEDQPIDLADEGKPIHRKLSDANDVRAPASGITDVDRIDMPQLLTWQIRDRYN